MRCGEVKAEDEFFRVNRDGEKRRSVCKACSSNRSYKWGTNADERKMLDAAKRRAKQQGVPFDLTVDDIHIPAFCPVLGVKLERSAGGSSGGDNSPSLDKIVPERGYVRGNVIVISNKANRMKSNGTFDEMRRLAEFYTDLEKQLCRDATTKPGETSSGASTASPNPSPRRMTTSKMNTDTVLLIDGDIFAYKASFGKEKELDLGDDIVSIQADLGEIETHVADAVEAVKDKLKADKIIVALSDDVNFRKAIYADYKANRNARRKPIGLRHAKEHLKKTFDTKIKPGIEADDVLGIMCTHPKLVQGKPVIVSIDKDLLQIPGRHFNPDRDEKRVVSLEQADLQFFKQCLTGDSTDNYPGCKGIGPVTALKLFAETGANWETVLAAYENAGLTAEFALVQARVARILRHTDYDFKRKEPILWTP